MSFFKKLFKWGFLGNVWISVHMGGGAIGARIGIEFWTDLQVLIGMFVITILWEVYEFIKHGGKAGMIKIYGSLIRWFYDSLGDVVGANLMALVVVY